MSHVLSMVCLCAMQGTDMYKNKYVQVWVVACVHTGRPALVVISLGLVCQTTTWRFIPWFRPFSTPEMVTHTPTQGERADM